MSEGEAATLLARKKKIRSGHKSSTTRLMTRATTALEAEVVDVDELSFLQQRITEKRELLKTLDSELAELVPDEGLEEEIQQADEYLERLYEVLMKLDKGLELASRTISRTGTPSPTSREGSVASVTEEVSPTLDRTTKSPEVTRKEPGDAVCATLPLPSCESVKLPKISLLHFRGNHMKWTAFWDSFESAIHRNEHLSKIDKFNYLRSLLEGTAYDAIAGLSLSAANYAEAVQILHKRFGNKQLIISKHMEALLGIAAVTADHHLRDLRRLYDQAESNIRSLKSLGVELKSYGAMLSSMLLSKLPPELRLIVSRTVPVDELSMEVLLETFEQELLARERANNSVWQQSRRGQSQNQGRTTTSAFVVTSQGPSGSSGCMYCRNNHPSVTCDSVTDVEARKKILRSSGRCFNCLKKNHLSRNCHSTSKCRNCQGRHHTSICERGRRPRGDHAADTVPLLDPNTPTFSPTTTTSTLCSTQGKVILLQTARTVAYNPHRPKLTTRVRILFDSGSQRSYLTERAVKQLQLKPTGGQTLSIATFGSLQEHTRVCPIVSVGICLKGEYPSMLLSLHVVPTICEPISSQPINASVESHDHLLKLELADSADGNSHLPVDLLIGCDYYWDLVTGSICRGVQGPTAIHTKLGWVLSGPTHCPEAMVNSVAGVVTTHLLRVDSQPIDESAQLSEQLRSFWELESLGIHEQEKTLYSEFVNHVSFQDGHYKVTLPWKELHDSLPDNYQLSVNRLKGLLRRLRHTPNLLHQYHSMIQEQLAKGIIEPVDTNEVTTNLVHYLPHHGVVRTDKATTKLRIVYDASSKTSGPSLNECLYKGPKFNQMILDLLIRFRSYRIALVADVEKAFLMISVDGKDRDVLRFIWVDDVLKEEPELYVYRFTRVVFGVSSSPFLLNATVRYHLERFLGTNEYTVKRLLQSTYVDDVISGAGSEEEAFQLYTEAKMIFRAGGFNLRKFLSNSPDVQARIDATEGVSNSMCSDVRVLGIPWNSNNDTLVFDLSNLAEAACNLQPTKRNVISLVGRIYDPLGFLAPVTIRYKILFQKLCKSKIDWDDDLTEGLLEEWKVLIAELREATPISVPRSYCYQVEGLPLLYTLCGFCDASKHAYASVVYLVIESENNTEVKFVVAKTRVAPLQPQTIPRLELLSAFLLSKLIQSVADSLSPNLPSLHLKCYTDSQVALFWIRGTTREWNPFVSNRVKEIRKRVHPDYWRHCPGSSNPADLPSRGILSVELTVSQLWRRGPEWLQMGFEPSTPAPVQEMPSECALEMKRVQSHSLVSTETTTGVELILDPGRYSKFSRLIGVTVAVLRAIRCFKKLTKPPEDDPLTNLRQEAELLWIRSAQKTLSDIKTLTKQFNLFKDDQGVWRCGGRLANTEVPYATKFPILLPKSHSIATLIVRQAHERVFHNGVKETLTQMRSKYWIPRGRSFTRKVLNQCVTCRRFEGLPFASPPPPPLPECRVKEVPAFFYTGVDFAGPLVVSIGQKGQSMKVWIALFTCYVTRAVHLETVTNQSTTAFIYCLKRFAARRGLPSRFISDNGKTFKAAAKYLDDVFKDGTVQTYLSERGITWQFNVERAPWWGGAFERIVRSTKRCLRKLIGRAHFSHEELTTTLTEIEAVLNSRPLSYVSGEDIDEPITPSHLIVGRRLLSLPDHLDHMCVLEDGDYTLDEHHVTRRIKHINNVLNHFWKRWRTEYLSNLREVHALSARKGQRVKNSRISVGDIVIIKDEQLPRGQWKLGVVQTLLTGQDGQTRAATVKLASSGRQHPLLRRPIQLLYPLEIHRETPVSDPSSDSSSESPPTTERPNPNEKSQLRPRRAAARQADEVRKSWISELEYTD